MRKLGQLYKTSFGLVTNDTNGWGFLISDEITLFEEFEGCFFEILEHFSCLVKLKEVI